MWWRFFTAVRKGQYKVAPLTWLAFAGTVAYTLMPLDFIPEILLGPVGLIDDLGLWGVMVLIATREKQKWQTQLERHGVIIDSQPVR